ncbi:ribonuclease P protein component [candidate division KSB3 bacterium]|uniref:Ribonuclease P protein component n=1 Tax=candidate division KSB3 bacterium TaxID=2044937 RepID=A0A9D5JS77_9BACT|nr:ribonuclease P protein component [candidate division KSB3 bacterium]MBD3323047.1 ribonuclease P protein component [candidate division KSB3 bacterium]
MRRDRRGEMDSKPTSASFARYERLTRHSEFARVYAHGEKHISSSVILYSFIVCQRPYRRLGVVVSKKVGNAVTRNRCKRVIREIFRTHKAWFPQGADLVVIVRRAMVNKPYQTVEEELCRIFHP